MREALHFECLQLDDRDLLLEQIEFLKPHDVLDIGCGCGSFTCQLAPLCRKITAVDISEHLIERCKREHGSTNIDYALMDGRKLDYPADHFDLVFIRNSLHHILEWQHVVDEMLRVSNNRILIAEPLNDLRSEAKRNSMAAQRIFFEIQLEVGYPHYPYIKPRDLAAHLRGREFRFEMETVRRDQPIGFDDFFEPWGVFAGKSNRQEYWHDRLSDFRRKLGDGELCQNDAYLLTAFKHG